jgi:hypothetical protein
MPVMPPKITDWILKPGAIPFEFFDADGTSGVKNFKF